MGEPEYGGVNSTSTRSPGLSSTPAVSAIPPSLSSLLRPSKRLVLLARWTITRIGTSTLCRVQRRVCRYDRSGCRISCLCLVFGASLRWPCSSESATVGLTAVEDFCIGSRSRHGQACPLKLLDSDFELPLRWDIFDPDDSEPRLGAFMSDPDEVTESGLALDTNKKRPITTNVRRGDIL